MPHGRTDNGGKNDRGAWRELPATADRRVADARARATSGIIAKHPRIARAATTLNHLGTLGTGNHFIEVCLDEADHVWFMLHSGSRGVGNRIGSTSSSSRRTT